MRVFLQVDIKTLSDAKGYSFYRDHLPVLGIPITDSTGRNVKFKIGDKVKIDLELEVVQSLQQGHGGWTYSMYDVSITSITLIIPSVLAI